jgi:hypothetical protein
MKEHMSQERTLAELAEVAAIRDRTLGPDHPDTLDVRHELALTYFHAGIGDGDVHLADAIETMEQVAESRIRILGTAHPETLGAWASLALFYGRAQRYDEIRALRERIAAGWEQVVAERERLLGPNEPDTQYARLQLTSAYRDVGRRQDERRLLEQVIASWQRLAVERERRLGPIHPDTVEAREHHAYHHRSIGRTQDEVSLMEQIASDHERLLGPTHSRTLRAQVRLASRYFEGGHDAARAIALGERIIDDVGTVLGGDHDDLRALRAVLILAYAKCGRTDDARAKAAP